MASYRSSGGRLWLTVLAALVVSLFALLGGGEPTQAIVGGTEVPNGKYPFMAYVGGVCGGTLIDRDSVLTAAHCFHNQYIPKLIKVQVYIGRTVRSSNQGQMRRAKWVSIHPRYHPTTRVTFDVAVLKLERAVTAIKPIKLATAKQNYLEKSGRMLTVAGWGQTRLNDTYTPDRMRQVRVPVVSDSRAERVLDAVWGSPGYEPPFMIAAGKKGKSSCHGDSGGPLFDSGSRTQVGIVSGSGTDQRGQCGTTARYPAWFAEVNNPKIRNFILAAARR
jgi:secreted trypsin-like serine protease